MPPGEGPAAPILAVIGTYSGHGQAADSYAGRTPEETAWGPHHGIPLVAPADGRIEVFSFGTPLSVLAADPDYADRYHALFGGWTCMAPPPVLPERTFTPGEPLPMIEPLQTMFVAVFWPSASLTIEGQRVGHLHYGHVRADIKAGAVRQGEPFATAWDSGIRWEPRLNTRAAHTHCVAGSGTALSPNGDLPGRLAAVAQGWDVTDGGTLPGPQDYETGRYCAGRLLSDFTRAGKSLPPMPS